MWAYILRRAALGLLTLFVISVISFVIIQLPPGDFVSTALAELAESGTETSDQLAAQMRAEYGLDRSLGVQYLIWMNKIVRGISEPPSSTSGPCSMSSPTGSRSACWSPCRRSHSRS